MANQKMSGFTIIEAMLFLSISGILFVGLMVGISTNINNQRYRDSVSSFAGLLQQQYSEVANIRNDRTQAWRCESSITTPDAETGQARGTTDCVVLGKYIRTLDSATKLEIGTVIGSEPSGNPVIDSDSAALAAYAPRTSSFDRSLYEPEWGALLQDTEGHPANFTIIILRSPLSGLLRVFAVPGPLSAPLADMMTSEAARQKITTCIVADGWQAGATQAVVVDAATAGASGVMTLGDNAC